MIDIDKFNLYFGPSGWIRKHVLQRLEHLRDAKIIGKSLEAGVKITYHGQNERDGLWDSNLIRTTLNVSWVELDFQYDSLNKHLTCSVVVWDLKKDDSFRQCARCFLFHRDSDVPPDLCRRCAGVMYSCYPNHSALDNSAPSQ